MKSIWIEKINMPRFQRLNGDAKTDVLIIGGGVAGLMCALELQNRGVDYILIEADRICHGITENTTAKVTSQHGLIYHKLAKRFGDYNAKLYWRANEDAVSKLQSLSAKYPCDFEIRDNYIYSTNDPKILDAEMDTLNRLGIPARLTTPGLPFSTVGAVMFSDQAQFNPLKFFAHAAQELTIYEETSAKEFAGNQVITDRGTITAEKIVVATHFPILNKHGFYFLKMYQDRSYVLAVEGAGEIGGMYLDEAKDGLSLRSYGDMLLVGCGSHRTGKKTEGWSAAEKFVKDHFPEAKVRCRWAAQDCITLDDMPYIGRYSAGTPDFYVVTGFNKWGMSTSVAAASILADQLQGIDNPYSALFSPSRTVLRSQLVVNGFEAACGWLRFPGPRCPHLGCGLKWNPKEHSWDCPCHGSRFTGEGKLEDGPATADLKNHRH